MKLNKEAAIRKVQLAEEATRIGRILFEEDCVAEQFDRGCKHVFGLLRDAHSLFKSNSFSTSTFLAITAIEEVAKLKIAILRDEQRTVRARRRNHDHLFDHKAKHSICTTGSHSTRYAVT